MRAASLLSIIDNSWQIILTIISAKSTAVAKYRVLKWLCYTAPVMSNIDNLSPQAQGEPELSADEQRQNYQSTINQAYRSLVGVLLGTIAAELILLFGS